MILEIHPCINPDWIAIKTVNPHQQYDFVDMMERAYPDNIYIMCHGGYENAVGFQTKEISLHD